VDTEGLGARRPPVGPGAEPRWGSGGKAPRSQICVYNLQWTNTFSRRVHRRYTAYLQAHAESATPTSTHPKNFEFVQISRPTLAEVGRARAYPWLRQCMHAGHSGKCVTRERFIPVHHISTKLGKRTAYSTLTNTVEAVRKLETFQDVPTFLDTARRFILLMHGKKSKTLSSLNELCFLLATTTDKPASVLPPTEDAFEQHVLLAQYQVGIWMSKMNSAQQCTERISTSRS